MAPHRPSRADQLARSLERDLLLWDGAMGTSIQQLNLPPTAWGDYPGCQEYLVISRPEIIREIHNGFLAAGARVVETDSFGANRLTLDTHGLGNRAREINRRAAQLAREAADSRSLPGAPCFVAGSMGPGSRLPSLGDVDFIELRAAYQEQARGLIEGGADLLQVETVQDLLQAKAALAGARRAARECRRPVPVTVQVTLDKGRMLLGSDILTAMHALLPLRPAAFGVNCGSGPEEVAEAVDRLSRHSPLPVMVMPNAGMPRIHDGVPVFDLSPADFAAAMARFARESGVRLLGGCCGTTPAHILALHDALKEQNPRRPRPQARSAFASLFQWQPTRVVPPPLIIGERTNANGSRAFRRALLANNLDAMVEIAREQQEEGAHMLDVSVAYAGRDEAADLAALTARLNRELRIPLVFDCTDPQALEAGLSHCAGHPLINSINLEDGGKRARRVIALAREYGAGIICLAIDEQGMARTRQRKLQVCRRLYELCTRAGIDPDTLYFDPLTFTLASGDAGLTTAGVETLEALPLIRQQLPGSRTLLGVSNISYGLKPDARRIINSVFLYHAVQRGLDAAIFHAGKVVPLHSIDARERELADDLIFNRARNGRPPLEAVLARYTAPAEAGPGKGDRLEPLSRRLHRAVVDGRTAGLDAILSAALQTLPALEIINHHLLPAMQRVGDLFSSGRMQLPFVLKSAQVMKAAVNRLSPELDSADMAARGTVVLATVRGDVHDIGKNLVDIILSNNGYRVVNLGINQSSGEIAAALRTHRPDALGISGLLVQSTLEMKELLLYLKREQLILPVICGGAALTRDFVAGELAPAYPGPVHYAADAFDALRILQGRQPVREGGNTAPPPPPPGRAVVPEAGLVTDLPRGVRRLNLSLKDILPSLDRDSLFAARWKTGPGKNSESVLQEILERLAAEACSDFPAAWGLFECRHSDGRDDQLFLPATGDILEFAPAPYPPSAWFARQGDLVPLLAVSTGRRLATLVQRRFTAEDYPGYLFWYGFAAQLAEAMAETLHRHIARELGVERRGSRRFSPGYPAWPDLAQQGALDRLLDFSRLDLELTDTWQLVPEAAVTALVVPRYKVERL